MKKYSDDQLQGKLSQMYPEINKSGASLSLDYDDMKKSWKVKLAKDGQQETIYLPEEDANVCMSSNYCQPFQAELKDALNRFAGK